MGGDASPAHYAKLIWSQLFGNAPTPTQSFAGQTVIITGSNTGLGFEAAKHVVRLGCARLVIAVRSVEKGEAARRSIVQAATRCDDAEAKAIIEVWPVDLTSYDSVKAFASRAERELDRVDVLLENAGVASVTWSRVNDNERMVAVNVVSTFLLALLLLPKLRATAVGFDTTPRLTVVTSDSHFLVDFPERDAPPGGIFDALNDEARSAADVGERYPTTKLLQVFVVREMAARLCGEAKATPAVVVNCVNPGMCKSELSREIDGVRVRVLKFLLARSTEAGSRVLVHGAAGGLDTHGQYMDLGRVAAPATVVAGPGGKEIQERVYAELMEKLEGIAPGVSANL